MPDESGAQSHRVKSSDPVYPDDVMQPTQHSASAPNNFSYKLLSIFKIPTQPSTLPFPSKFLPMRRQSSEPASLNSSIALLQERFRQLQRVKEKREEREQRRASNEHLHLQQQQQQQQPKWFVHPELMHPSSHLRNTSSLLLGESNGFNEFQSMEASLSLRSWPPPASVIQSPNGFDEEVDTSLHL